MAEETNTDPTICGVEDLSPEDLVDIHTAAYDITPTDSSNVCGISATPLPTNDPTLDTGSINAYSSRYGIQINWSYPTSNPHMMAYSTVYKSTGGDFANASYLARVSTDNYTDLMDNEEFDMNTRYYYWVVHTSINGTVGVPIGPASAIWLGGIQDILDRMQGLIEESQLDNDLRERINDISGIRTGLRNEIANRYELGATLSALIAEIKQDLESTDALVGSAVTEIVNDNYALAAKVNIVMAQWNGTFAGVQEEVFAVASDTDAIAGHVETIQSKLLIPGGNPDNPDDYYSISVQQEMITSISSNVGDMDQLGNVPVYQLDENGNLVLDASGNPVPIENPTLSDRLLDVYGQWSVRIDNDGHVSGFGLRSSGTGEERISEFIVNANIFAIGAPENLNNPDGAQQALRPFIVYQDPLDPSNSLVTLNTDVFIKNGTIRNAMIDNVIESTNWNWHDDSPTLQDQFTGWHINKNGNAYFNNLTARGEIEATSIKANTVDVIDTLMIQDNAVTIPEATHIPYGGGIGGHIDIDPQIKNLATITLIWGDSENIPKAFIINAIYMAFGTPIGWTKGQRVSKAGDGVITVYGEYGFVYNEDEAPPYPSLMGTQIHPADKGIPYQSYAVSMPAGYGAMVTGLWHINPPTPNRTKFPLSEYPTRKNYHWGHFTLRGRTNPDQNSREISNVVMSILGAKR